MSKFCYYFTQSALCKGRHFIILTDRKMSTVNILVSLKCYAVYYRGEVYLYYRSIDTVVNHERPLGLVLRLEEIS